MAVAAVTHRAARTGRARSASQQARIRYPQRRLTQDVFGDDGIVSHIAGLDECSSRVQHFTVRWVVRPA
jgi:hypothetical protein